MNNSELIANFLKKYNIGKVFVYPGGTVAPLLDALYNEGIEIICFRNEQGAGYAALGAAKITGKPQIAIVTSGPGATNILTPVADAYYDSVPLIIFTGQVATQYMNFNKIIRQTGFQETDTKNIFYPVTKKTIIAMPNEDIVSLLQYAYLTAQSGRPGPVVVDLPMDSQTKEFSKERVKFYTDDQLQINGQINQGKIVDVIRVLEKSKRPLILAGNGIYVSDAVALFREFVEKIQVPVISSMPAVGVMPKDHPLYFDFLGHTGEFYANLAMYYSDLVLILGSRLDIRQVGTEIKNFEEKTIIRIDIDEKELINGKIRSNIAIKTDISVFLKSVLSVEVKSTYKKGWVDLIKQWKKKYSSSLFYERDNLLYMKDVIKEVSKITNNKKVIVSSGVGGHQQMVARYFDFDYSERRWITSAGHGTMGFDLPAMLGAILEGKNYFDFGVVFVGDGSFQMNIQELATLNELSLPVKIFVLDDKRLGIVSQFQIMNWGKDPTTGGKKNPNFAKIAKGYGINSIEIRDKKDLPKIKDIFSNDMPWVVHCYINSNEDVLPMLLSGQRLNEMYPFGKVEIDL